MKIDTELKIKASAALQKEIEEELKKKDPQEKKDENTE